MLIQPILFPPSNFINVSELFFRGIPPRNIYENKVVIPAGSMLSLGTYFNAFSVGKWMEYAGLDNLVLKLKINGSCEIKAYHSTGSVDIDFLNAGKGKRLDEEYIQEVNSLAYNAVRKETECTIDIKDDVYTIKFNELYKDGILYITIETLNDTIIQGGGYATETDESALNPVKLALGVCTFKRETAVIGNVNRIIDEIINNPVSQLKDKLEVYIADNGQTLNKNQFKSDKIHLFPNPNLGGSGGFTRTMVEAMFHDASKEFTHIIFMDDDILLYPAVLERSFYLLSLLKPEYKKAILGAGMFMLEKQWLQQELGAYYEDNSTVPGRINHKFFDLRNANSIAANEIVNPTNYTGWWYACIPSTIISSKNLPMPFFIHYDDVEYGLRNVDNGQLFINGICVWHPAPANKNPAWILYYDVRNRLITMFTKDLAAKDFNKYLRVLTKRFILKIVRYGYDDAELILMAIKDFLKGPRYFIDCDALSLHSKLLKKKVVYCSPEAAGIDKGNIIKKRYSNYKKAVLIQFFCNFLPPKNTVRALNNRYYNIPYRASKLFLYNEKIEEGVVWKRDQKKFFIMLFSFLKVRFLLKINYKKLLNDWRQARSILNSLSFWEQYLGINKK